MVVKMVVRMVMMKVKDQGMAGGAMCARATGALRMRHAPVGSAVGYG